MTALDLDPMFVKALKLLHSKSTDSKYQLKQMLDDVLMQRKGGKRSGDSGSGRNTPTWGSIKSSSKGDRDTSTSSSEKRKESEKRLADKTKDYESGLKAKKPKIEASEKEPREKVKDVPEVFTQTIEKHERIETLTIPEKPKTLKIPEKRTKTESETESSDEDISMAADDFAVDMGIACVVCRQFDVASGNQLIECQECHSLYHQECHKPPVTNQDVNDPRFVWYCFKCQKNLKKLVASKPQKPKSSSSNSSPTLSTPVTSSGGYSFLNKDKDNSSSKVGSTSKSESSLLQPFRRIDPSVKTTRESPTGQSKPLFGLAGLAANLSGKTEKSNVFSKSETSGKSLLKPTEQGKGLFSMQKDAVKSKSSESSKSSKSGSGSDEKGPSNQSGLMGLASMAVNKKSKDGKDHHKDKKSSRHKTK